VEHMKVVINRRGGSVGAALSPAALSLLAARGSKCFETAPDGTLRFNPAPELRSDPVLVAVVEELGEAASAPGCLMKVVEASDKRDLVIHTTADGVEFIEEKARTYS
jgi:hypothetical protein